MRDATEFAFVDEQGKCAATVAPVSGSPKRNIVLVIEAENETAEAYVSGVNMSSHVA